VLTARRDLDPAGVCQGVQPRWERSVRYQRRAVGGRLHARGGRICEDGAATGIGGDQRNEAARNAGAAYLFRRTDARWAQQAYVKASNAGASDLFGGSVALSGDGATLVVGAYFEASAATGIDGNQADNTKMNAGAAYVFE